MPNATISGKIVRKDLRHCPGGWVDLKQLNYDQMLERRDNVTKMFMEQHEGQETGSINLKVMNKWACHHDFRNCIVDHNLEDADGNKLNFNNSLTFSVLDPRIGAEIERYIDELNQDLEGDMESFFSPASGSLTENSDMKELSEEE